MCAVQWSQASQADKYGDHQTHSASPLVELGTPTGRPHAHTYCVHSLNTSLTRPLYSSECTQLSEELTGLGASYKYKTTVK